jgi:two-component system, LytTR family, sensor kinase
VLSSEATDETASRQPTPAGSSSKSPLWNRTRPVTMSPPSLTSLPEHNSPRRTSSLECIGGASGRTWRQWFVPSRVTSAFFAFNTVFWGFMIVARYEFAVFAHIDSGNLLGWAIRRGCFGWVFGCMVHLIVSQPWLAKRSWPIRLVVGVGIASLLASGISFMQPLAPESPQTTRMIVTWLWCGLYFGLEANDNQYRAELEAAENVSRAALAEAAARENELRHLEAQMNPHFLFNALNCIVAARHDPDAVARVTQDLADYLRFSLRESRPLEPLSRELDALEHYLGVQQSRFGAGLICRIDCEPDARSVPVPPMMLQPLLENAFHYGGQTSPRPLRVDVAAALSQGWLTLSVVNTGAWVSPDSSRSPGSGIQTLRKRLALLIGDQATVDVVSGDGSVKVLIRIPDTRTAPAQSAGQRLS